MERTASFFTRQRQAPLRVLEQAFLLMQVALASCEQLQGLPMTRVAGRVIVKLAGSGTARIEPRSREWNSRTRQPRVADSTRVRVNEGIKGGAWKEVR